MKRVHRMPFGAQFAPQRTQFRLWAPGAQRVELELNDGGGERRPVLERRDDGWHALDVDGVQAGARYAFCIDGDLVVPDPASRFNPEDVHRPSAVVDPQAYAWRDAGWRGRPWHEAVVYELHVGTFTPEGTFAATARHFDHLVALGVTAIEIMPVADFPGARNWGYDGVLPFAPDASYGTPDDLKRLVDDAHARGLMVLLDVVYNHFGPEGNYLHAYAPQFFNPKHQTPWGAAINFDGEHSATVREFFVHNALYWLDEFHFDGLRLDAVHAIADDSRPDVVDWIAAAVRSQLPADRHVHMVLENDRNEARRLVRSRDGTLPLATAQWNDDFHHALHVVASGERDGYYADYADRPLEAFGKALAEGFVFQGQPSAFRDGEKRGEPSASLPPAAFVNFAQNHDQVGNRALGERLHTFANADRLRTAIACMLLAPPVPMLFMGEEFAASSPFLFFCDFGPELADAVTRGRREEFGRFERFRDPAVRASIPDPNAAGTFERSKLAWRDVLRPEGANGLAFHRACLAARREHVVPLLPSITRGGRFVVDGERLRVDWSLDDGRRLALHANFGATPVAVPDFRGIVLHATGVHRPMLDAGAVAITLEPA
jgi:maltooligosyltrehalose trehalohydrolase